MASKYRMVLNSVIRRFSQQNTPSQSAPSEAQINVNVPGLSEAVVEKADGSVGPGVESSKSGDYKVPEYFCYNTMSYYEAEIEMNKFRLPQPSNKA